MKRTNQRKRRNLTKMTVQAYACSCGTPADCLADCKTYDQDYVNNAVIYAGQAADARK